MRILTLENDYRKNAFFLQADGTLSKLAFMARRYNVAVTMATAKQVIRWELAGQLSPSIVHKM